MFISDTEGNLQKEYKRRNPGGHWFDTSTMAFFRSSIYEVLSNEQSGIWRFITSERPPRGVVRYSVREMGLDGDINTDGSFCELTHSQALDKL